MILRPQPRRKIFHVGELRVAGQVHRVHLLDISEGGARLHCSVAIEPGSAVVLGWQGHSWRGVIAWQADAKCGVRFLVPLSPSGVAELTAP